MKKVVYITGARSDFGPTLPTLRDIEKHDGIELSLIVTGMHLLEKYGNTVKEVEKSGLKVARTVPILIKDDDANKEMALTTGNCVMEMTKVLSELKPDVVLVVGDRFETFASVVSAVFLNIPVAHISGGDISKSIDDSIRYAITKLSHLHFPGTKKSAERLAKVGEEKWRIHMVGTPINMDAADNDEIESELGVELSDKIILVIQHPVTIQSGQSGKQMQETLDAVAEIGKQAIVIYPNNDAGNEAIIKVIDSADSKRNISAYRNLSSRVFMGLLKHSSVIVGNSSSGIIEAPFFGLPCVNIGIRQEGRERGDNVVDVDHKKEDIIGAIKKVLVPSFREKLGNNPYDSGNRVGEEIARVLDELKIDGMLMNKQQMF
jgi:GDP/UDP-N,N'-diacetylbacillosamine 2-epimerase (hydrolysing)